MVAEEEVDVDMRDAQEPDSTHTTAQTTSWEEFERFGFAEGSYTHKFHAFDEAVDNPQKSNKVYSDEFEIAAYSWQLLVMPKGNDQKPGQQASISIFLKSAEAKVLPPSILPKASFKLSIINHVNPEGHVEKDTEHRFSEKEDDWGFMAFCALADLKAKKDEFFPDGVLHIKTTMRVELEEKYTGVTRQRTGYVGLKNQGATCYMNSLLQALFHVKQFRRAVYHMPTQEGEEADGSIPLAMKHLFFRLQYSPTPVSTKELVRSFGWTSMEAFVQQDVEELELKLCEKLEEKMKGTIVDKSVDRLLKGKTYNFIKCKNVDYSSTKTEEFLDLQLDVMGCKGVQDSLDKICKVEELVGDNKYDAEGHGLQDATKGILFQDLPPVLQLHLRRFDFDLQSWTSIKVNSRYEFHDTLDFNPEHMAPTADPAVPPHYKLYAVLVHSGASQGGHYYAYIRPDKRKEEWFKFDDETVTQVDQEEAISQQYGGESTQLSGGMSGYRSKPRSLNNAYMLVYVRDLDWDKVMAPTGKDEVSEHVRKELEQQLAAKDAKRRAKMQAHRFVSFKVVTDSLIKKHVETEAFHLANTDDLPEDHTFKLDKTLTWHAVMQRIEELTGIPAAQQVYFLFVQQGQQHRPAIPLFPQSHANEPIKHKHRSLIQNELAPRGHNIRMGYVKGGGMSTLNPVVMYVHHLQTETVSSLESNILNRCLVFVKEYSPEERMMRLLKSIVVQRGVLVRDFVRGCLGSTDAAPVECPDNFIMWEEEQTEPELLLPEVQDKMSLDQVLDMEGGEMVRHGNTFIVQRVVEAGLAAAQRAAVAANGEGSVAAAAVAAGMSASARAKEEQPPISAASHYRAGTAGAYDANAPAAAVSAVPAANGTHVEAPQDDLMHDTTENEVVPGADDFATADGFMRHVHSLRRLIFSPLPGGVGVRGVPGSTSTANLTLQGDAAGDSADGAPASTGASVGGGLPTVTIEVLKNAAYEDVVRALANKLGQCQPQYLRITLHNAYTQLPLRRPLESGQAFVAQRCHSFTHPFQVYYEVLDMPLEELEKLKALRVKMVKANTELVRMLTVRLAPAATIADLLEKAMQQAAPGYADSKKLRALKVYSARVFEVCSESASIDDIDTSYWQLRVEPVPPDDLETAQRCTQEGVEFIPAFFTHSHMQQETIHDYGDPLVLLLHPKESMESVISRIRQRLKLEEDDVKDWKWGVRAHLSQPEQITELSTVVAERLAEMAEHQSMKFEHPPFISMFHEQKGYAGRAPQAHNWVGREAQINIS